MLKRLFKQFKVGQKGFTLIELLVVVAILGVLAAVAIPNVAKFIGRGQDEANSTELANVQTAVTAYMADHNFGWATDDGTETGGELTTTDLLDGKYLTQATKQSYSIANDGTVSVDAPPAT